MFNSLNRSSFVTNCVTFQNLSKDEMEKPDSTSDLEAAEINRLRQELHRKDEELDLLRQELQAENGKLRKVQKDLFIIEL
jgi:hypothetical protein